MKSLVDIIKLVVPIRPCDALMHDIATSLYHQPYNMFVEFIPTPGKLENSLIPDHGGSHI